MENARHACKDTNEIRVLRSGPQESRYGNEYSKAEDLHIALCLRRYKDSLRRPRRVRKTTIHQHSAGCTCTLLLRGKETMPRGLRVPESHGYCDKQTLCCRRFGTTYAVHHRRSEGHVGSYCRSQPPLTRLVSEAHYTQRRLHCRLHRPAKW